MTNILIDELPETIQVAGRDYQINSNHKVCLRSLIAFEDNELTPLEKQYILMVNLLPVIPPDPNDQNEALEQINLFLAGGNAEKKESDGLRLYSFRQDAPYIYAAFRQTHGIDLQKIELHWWQFLSLFMDLGSETMFCQLVGLRKRLATPGKASKEDKQMAAELGHIVKLDGVDDRTVEEKEVMRKFDELVAQGLKNKT